MGSGLKYYRWSDYCLRGLWALAHPMFRWSPRVLAGWRNLLLRLFGARIARGVMIFPSTVITFPWKLSVGSRSVIAWGVRLYNLDKLEIGERVVISQGAHLCGGTHDYESADFKLIKACIWIGDDAWIGADAFIGPGVHIGRGAVVGARAVVVKDVPPQTIVAGNPARIIKMRGQVRQR